MTTTSTTPGLPRPEDLSARQLDGLDCIWCGASTPTMVPAPTVDGRQMFRCEPACVPAMRHEVASLKRAITSHTETSPAATGQRP